MSTKNYRGSCHCGKVRYDAELDLTRESSRCNCSICLKSRHWGMLVQPAQFKLLSGESDLSDYQFAMKLGHHRFCKHCGVRVFGHGDVPQLGGAFVSINLATLDEVDAAELARVPIRYMDGRNDNWGASPQETGHL
jgi:hypothetical protein